MSYLPYTLFEHCDGSLNFIAIMSTRAYRAQKTECCRTIKCGTYEELLHYCAENHIEF